MAVTSPNLTTGKRTVAARVVARALRASQGARIAAQKKPDGSAYVPRKKKKLRARKGRIRRAAEAKSRTAKTGPMIQKLRTAAYMTADGDPVSATVAFKGAAANRIARVHQLGLRDRVSRNPNAPEVTYPQRVILDFSPADRVLMLDVLLAHLAK